MSTLNKKNYKNSALISIILMMILTLFTQFINLAKNSIAAANFGTTLEMDAFNLTNSIGIFVFSFIGTGITTVLIPVMINKNDEDSTNNFLSILYVLSLLSLFIVLIFRRDIISLISNSTSDFDTLASNLIVITLLTQLSMTFLGVTNAYFQVIGKFNIPKVLTLVTTLGTVLLLVTSSEISIFKYATIILIGTSLNVFLQFFTAFKKGYKYRFNINLKDENLRNLMRIFLPTVLSTGLYQFTLLTDTFISSTLGAGQISILSYSNTVMSMINMLLVGNLMTYIYPTITKSINEENNKDSLFSYVTFFNFIMCLVVVGFIVVGREGIAVLYERGEFDSWTTTIVYYCSIIYAIGLPINIARDIVYRYFYAKGNTKSTLYNSISASFINLTISILLSFYIGIYGIIIGTVVTSLFSLISILIRFKKNYGGLEDYKFVRSENLKILLATFITISITLIIKMTFEIDNNIAAILFYGVLVVLTYGLTLYILRSKVLQIKI